MRMNRATLVSVLFAILAGQPIFVFAQQNAQPMLVEPAFQIPLSKLPLNTFDSPNDNFTAIVCPDDKNTFIYRVNWQGNTGYREKQPIWKVQDCFKEMWIANDGQSIVGTKFGKGVLPSDYARDQIIFSFYKNGQLLNQVTVAELIGNLSKLEKTSTGYRWAKDIYLNDAEILVVETRDGENHLFEMATGKPILLEKSKFAQTNWKVFRDLRRCYEFQYPNDYLISPPTLTNPLITDFLLKKENMGWLFDVSVEETRDRQERNRVAHMTFEDFVIERMKPMYQADGADSSQYATDVMKKEAFKNQNGLNVLSLYLTVVNETFSEDPKESTMEKRTEGPIYAVSISLQNTPHKALILRLIDEGTKSKENENILRKMVDTVRIVQ
jgi:hypothetical protein